MQRSSLFRKYFVTFLSCAVLIIMVLGVVLMLFATQYFRNEKYDLLGRNARLAASVTTVNYASNNFEVINSPMITVAYTVLASAIDAEIVLTDKNGKIMVSSNDTAHYLNMNVPPEAVEKSFEGGFSTTTTLGGLFEEPHYVVGVPVDTPDYTFGVIFAASSARSLQQFLSELTKMFLISAAVVLFISSVVIYMVTMRLVRPLRDMLSAIQSFTQGDFSKRVAVVGYDEIGQLAMAFNNMAASLATTEQARRSFVANVSHELKTPMTTISGFVDGILDGTVPEEKKDQYLHVVSNEVKRLSRLVRSMLDTSRIEAGEMRVVPVIFDSSETIRQTVFSFERIVEEKELEVRGLEVDKIMVRADVDLMHQVVYNLVENAVKFVNENGCLEFSYRSDSQFTYVAIRNSGEGIDRGEGPQLFERFYKSDKSRSLNKNGVGLGLHIVRSIVNYHKGEVVVRSEEGEYTEFEFSIPNPPKKEQRQQNETKGK